jgi:hypothetical protein
VSGKLWHLCRCLLTPLSHTLVTPCTTRSPRVHTPPRERRAPRPEYTHEVSRAWKNPKGGAQEHPFIRGQLLTCASSDVLKGSDRTEYMLFRVDGMEAKQYIPVACVQPLPGWAPSPTGALPYTPGT